MRRKSLIAPVIPGSEDKIAWTAVRRFQVASLVAIVAAGVPYLWVLSDLWTGRINPLRTVKDPETVYDVQARAIMHGHITIPVGSIGGYAFTHGGRSYTYFGIFPSLLRMPVLLFTHSFDGRLAAPSMLGAWLVTAVFSALLLWRIRIVVRGAAPLGWAETASQGILLFSVLAGSVLLFLASQPDVFSEDLAWSVALACASLFALVGVIQQPSSGRIALCCLLVLLTNLNRATTGYAFVLAMFFISGWFALGRAGPDRRRWALPMLLAALVPLIAGCAIDLAKFGLLFGLPPSEEGLIKGLGLNHLNGGHYFGLRYVPSTLQAYLDPLNIRVTPVFPYLTAAEVPTHLIAHTQLFERGQTASVPPSMPLLFGVGLWGVIAVFTPHRRTVVRGIRVLLVAAALTAGSIMIFGWILERFVADFMPLLVLASMIGMVDIYSRLEGRRRVTRALAPALIALTGLFGFVANIGFAVAPASGWTQQQAGHYVDAERDFSDFTGHPLSRDVVRGSIFPIQAPMGQLFVMGNCDALYITAQPVPSGYYNFADIWLLVELAPDTPICRSLIGSAVRIPLETKLLLPSNNTMVSGSKLILVAVVSSSTKITSVSFVLDGTSLAVQETLGSGTTGLGVGWIHVWNTHSVPDGTYVLMSVATDAAGHSTTSPGITITVHNPTSTG